jgi:hypothetical protein
MLWFFFGLGMFCLLAGIAMKDRMPVAAAFGFWGLAMMPLASGAFALVLWGLISISVWLSLIPVPTPVLRAAPGHSSLALPFRQAACRPYGHSGASGDRV